MNYLASLRNELKSNLSRTRVKLVKGRIVPVCGICGGGVLEGAPDMHEGLLTRRDVQGNPDLLPHIMIALNCILVHPGGNNSQCHSLAHSTRGKIIAFNHLRHYEREEHIIAWLKYMDSIMKTDTAMTVLNILEEACNAKV